MGEDFSRPKHAASWTDPEHPELNLFLLESPKGASKVFYRTASPATTILGTLFALGFCSTIVSAIAIGRADPLGLTLVFAVLHWWQKGHAQAKGVKALDGRRSGHRFRREACRRRWA